MNEDERLNKTIKQGAVGGLLGACVGIPGLGIILGVANANKDKIKEFKEEL